MKCTGATIQAPPAITITIHNVDAADQCEDQLAANSMAARNFIEDMDLSMVNQDRRQL